VLCASVRFRKTEKNITQKPTLFFAASVFERICLKIKRSKGALKPLKQCSELLRG